MELDIREVKDRGTPKERIVFIVNETCDIGRYLVFTTHMLKGNEFSSALKDPYWFPDKKVAKGDLVVLYTKKGSASFKNNSDETITYFYYRDFESPILKDNIALIIKASTWNIEKS